MSEPPIPGHSILEFKRHKLEKEAQKNWDKFYKRNSDAFFKDRHWTRGEFAEIFHDIDLSRAITFLEVGCGVGNLLVPLAGYYPNWTLRGVDFSKNAIALLNKRVAKENLADRITAAICDIATSSAADELFYRSAITKVDLASVVFVLSSISPEKHQQVVCNIKRLIRPGGSLLFRDYADMDHAMMRFGRGSKIADRFYTRVDGTRAYFFTKEELEQLFTSNGFVGIADYIRKKTVNRKEQLEVDRVFVQARFVLQSED